MNDQLNSIKEMLGEMKDDSSVPRNIRSKINNIIRLQRRYHLYSISPSSS